VADVDARIGGRYRLDSRLASGGMGTVWLGWDERLQRRVAVKTLHLPSWLMAGEREVVVKRAMREARITARLHHPNAVQVFDVVDGTDGPCLIMEYVPSRSLQAIVDEDGPLRPVEAARIGTQVAAALAAAHRAGIVHRDVKPGNVLIAEDGSAKITDFGISHAFGDSTLTSTGMLTGTPAYLAPEVARGNASDFASDVYSLGATLYLAVEGRPPSGRDQANPIAVLHRVASGAWEPPTSSGPLTPTLTRMMSPAVSRRPSMVEVANALSGVPADGHESPGNAKTELVGAEQPTPPAADPVAAGDTSTSAASPVHRTHPVPPVESRGRWPWLPIVAALVLVAVGAGLAAVLVSRTGHGHQKADVPTSVARPPRTTPTPNTSRPGPTTSTPSSRASTPTTPPAGSSLQPAAPTSRDLANAVIGYFNLVPGNLDAGWARLTAHFQSTKAENRRYYDNFWSVIERVDVRDVRGEPPDAASATLVYHYKDGRIVAEPAQFRFVRQDGVLKINAES
jgi:serine/threonine protein kinase